MGEGRFSGEFIGPSFKQESVEPEKKPELKPYVITAEKTTEKTEIKPIAAEREILDDEEVKTAKNEGKKLALERIPTRETGLIPPVVINYPSGLRLVLLPVFDSKNPSIESFTGCFKALLLVPPRYDQQQNFNWNQVELEVLIPKGFREIPLNLALPINYAFPFEEYIKNDKLQINKERRVSQVTIPEEKVLFTLGKDFSAGYNPDLNLRLVVLPFDELIKSEKSLVSLFHELAGHQVLFGKVEKLLVQLALRHADVFDPQDTRYYNLTIIHNTETDLAIALLNDLGMYDFYRQSPSQDFSKVDLPSLPIGGEIRELAETLIEMEEQLTSKPPKDIQELLRILKKTEAGKKAISLFHERTAWAKARQVIRFFQQKYGVTFQMKREKLKNHQTACLETYANFYHDPRFTKGFRLKKQKL